MFLVYVCKYTIFYFQDGEVKAIVGASGGANIIPGTAEVLMNHFVKGMKPFSAVVAPRFYHQV